MCNDCEVDYEHVDIAREDFEQAQYFKGSSRICPLTLDSLINLKKLTYPKEIIEFWDLD